MIDYEVNSKETADKKIKLIWKFNKISSHNYNVQNQVAFPNTSNK
jgi:hypothetical protein